MRLRPAELLARAATSFSGPGVRATSLSHKARKARPSVREATDRSAFADKNYALPSRIGTNFSWARSLRSDNIGSTMKRIASVLLATLVLGACATPQQTAGTTAGAVGGALIGGPVGAVVGGATGAVVTAPGVPLGGSYHRCRYYDRYGHVHSHRCRA